MVGVGLGVWVLVLFGFGLLIYYAAQHKKYFTAPREGSVEFVMAGNSASRMLLVWRGHKQAGKEFRPQKGQSHPFDQYEIVPGEEDRGMLYYLNPLNWMEPFGIYWVGIWPFFKIYRYDFIWTEDYLDEQTGKIVPKTRSATRDKPTEGGPTSFIYVNDFNYYIVASNVKTVTSLPLNITVVITVRIVNPAKALFSGEDWLQRTNAAIGQMIIRYTGKLTYEQINGSEPAMLKVLKTDTVEQPYPLEKLICTLSDGDENELYGVDLRLAYGVDIKAVKVHSIELADKEGQTTLQDATVQVYTARQKGLAELAEAEGKAQAIEKLADAEEYRINTSYSPIAGDDKEARMKIRQLEAMEKSGSQGGNTIVVPDEVLGLARRFAQK